ncbi:hypothetical protein DENSPDRAFT_689399 [Dentipellis sp. KUC8613]|nr:hypothetical protein DENSPDRAFT_689399 [Dentipellis sp. KUC8613]
MAAQSQPEARTDVGKSTYLQVERAEQVKQVMTRQPDARAGSPSSTCASIASSTLSLTPSPTRNTYHYIQTRTNGTHNIRERHPGHRSYGPRTVYVPRRSATSQGGSHKTCDGAVSELRRLLPQYLAKSPTDNARNHSAPLRRVRAELAHPPRKQWEWECQRGRGQASSKARSVQR